MLCVFLRLLRNVAQHLGQKNRHKYFPTWVSIWNCDVSAGLPSLPPFLPTPWTLGPVAGAEAGEVLGVSGGQVHGAMVREPQPDPVLSINLNPYPRAPELLLPCLAASIIALKMTLHLKVPLCKHPTGTDSHRN